MSHPARLSLISIRQNLYRFNKHVYLPKRFSSVTAPPNKAVFNSFVHNLNKQRASLLSNTHDYDYFRLEIATRLISRMLDLDRTYPKTLDFGSHSSSIYKELINFIRQNPSDKIPAGIEDFYELETCKELLFRDIVPEWKQQLIKCHKIHHDVEHIEHKKLPFDDNTFDMIVSGMSLHWNNNIPFIFSEISRIMKPDGCFIGAFSGASSLGELRSSLLLSDQERKGGMNSHMSPAINISDIGGLLKNAGFVMITVDNEIVEIPYPNMFVLCEHLHGSGDQHAPVNDATDMRYKGISKDGFIAAAAIYDAMYCDSQSIEKEKREDLNQYVKDEYENVDNISIDATAQIVYFMGWKPDPSQSKPMKRGTAQYSLKDLEEITDIIQEQENEDGVENDDDNIKQ